MPSFWEEESYPAWQDYCIVVLFSCAWPLARLLLDSLIYGGFGRYVIFPPTDKPMKKYLLESKEKTFKKFKESCWKLTYFSLSEAYVLAITHSEPWALNSAAFWDDWPNQTLKNKLKVYYTAQGGFYMYSVVALLFWETRRKDFVVMMTHHVVTIGLVSYSYITGNSRVGSIVLALHDFSDIFLEAAKLFKYADKELIASVLFGCFALSWFLLRLVYFPFWIIWSTSVENLRYIDNMNPRLPWDYYQFNTLLIILLVLHIYWWMLISRMILRQLKNSGQVGDDVRSDSDDD